MSQGILNHNIGTFVGIGGAGETLASNINATRSLTLLPGNHEWPFEIALAGNTTESVEGIRKASVTYQLKATVARGNVAYNLRTYKHLRIIRIPEASALDLSQTICLKSTWLNKIEYSIVVPQRAIILGSAVPLEIRVTPLLKALELRDIAIHMLETHNITLPSRTRQAAKEHITEREIGRWTITIHGSEHWKAKMDGNGQAGWVVETFVSLPRKLSKCVQDVDTERIRIRHKLKLVMSLRNPDKHISELQGIIPVAIYVSPDISLGEDGSFGQPPPYGTADRESPWGAPPRYGEHILF